ncbi:MAG: 2-amino-4-hydroxy-6-hydroxymethyldihydropteridine diphosphokinase [Prolixibacteraceae bacterium]|jgi:2-amino-4-hydroxy-6-hydroxymethyldihydropteridine diphosphokinase|nr:2-amino-4-hydroxy-6-hydroxymethyldihydropteridine diphosphokinase [Prolixibacteraceae bacterium]
MSLVYLILGGNQGNRGEIIASAIDMVNSKIGQNRLASSLYESESWGFSSELFINQVIAIETNMSPREILATCRQIEDQLGRIRTGGGYEARTIDIDLLYYDSVILESPGLTIPHPRIADRRFVLVPLSEIAPDYIDPLSGKTVVEMLQDCTDQAKVWRLAAN